MPKINFAVGGQAILEGVMMRSPHHYVMAVRNPKGKIVVETRRFVSFIYRSRVFKLPLVRGMVVLIESLVLGTKALMFSNAIFLEEPEKDKKAKEKGGVTGFKAGLHATLKGLGITLYFIFIFAVAIFLFKFLPLLVADQLSRFSSVVGSHYWLYNAIDGVTKIAVFMIYLLLISLLPDIRRVFAYHGAEHQSIWAYEKGKSLTTAHVQQEHPEHPRCGTSFIIFVLILSVIVYTVLPADPSFWVKLGERVLALPLIAGLSYEVLKFSAKFETKWWMGWVTLPGLWIQKITTRKPSDDMVEVAVAALQGALEAERAMKAKGR